MIAFEAYNVREDLYTTHFSSKPMGVFLPKIAKTMTTGLDLTHFEDVGGFLDKPGDKKECGIFTVTKFLAKKGKREELIKKLVELARHVEESEKDTYTSLVLKSLDNETDIRTFERYASRKALEEHTASKEVINCLMGSKDEISSMESRSFIPNGRGWLHR
jgi:quinol monooxygenase YgiN